MAVVVIMQNNAAADGCKFSRAMPGITHLASETGHGIQLPDNMPRATPALMGWLAVMLAGGQPDAVRWDPGWPEGYLVALGSGLDCDPSLTWGVLLLSHLRQHRDQLVFDHNPEERNTGTEVMEYLATLAPPFAELGWRIYPGDGDSMVLSTTRECQVDVQPLQHLHGKSLQTVLPQGKGAGMLLTLMTTGQLILARAETNSHRIQRGLPPMNTPWIQGVARGDTFFDRNRIASPSGSFWCSDTVASGLGRHASWTRLPWTAPESTREADSWESWQGLATLAAQAAANGPVLLQFSITNTPMLTHIGHTVIQPLVQLLGNAHQGLLLVVQETGRDGQNWSWGFGRGKQLLAKKRFWRPRTWGQGTVLTLERAREFWLS
ncbi:MAG: hypothetical protein HQL77_12660 [Magnetococcales bacterium]|nr:hypothetical protein [Magnetococcales bacterium]